MNTITLKDGTVVPQLGQGTWYLGEKPQQRQRELSAIRAGIDAGMTLIDTAEMYGDGQSESLVGEAISGYDRDKLFLVSKVYPWNAGKRSIFSACENSLRRMKTDYLDLYLLHWRGSVPLRETVECMETLVQQGKIRRWGVSNLDREDMAELASVKNGSHCMVDQVLYHLGSRGIEYDLLPWMRKNNVMGMAYCPIAQGGDLNRRLLRNETLLALAQEKQATVYQILLAFVLQERQMIAIPRSIRKEHTLENRAAAEIILTEEDMQRLNQAFPAPNRPTPLDIV